MAGTSQRPRAGAANTFDDYMPDDIAGFAGSLTDEEQAIGNGRASKESATEGLGIDKEVEVKKRAREPRVKLDEARLLSDRGIPALRKRARALKIKGKGHEFSDAHRLLSMYQLWLDDLFPKARFADALAMVEKEGHKISMHKMRTEWINESKPRDIMAEADAFLADAPADDAPQPQPSHAAGAPSTTELDRDRGPDSVPDDLFDDDDFEDMMRASTPSGPSGAGGAAGSHRPSDIPDEDELDEMMAMASEMHGELPDRPPPMREPPMDEPLIDDMDDLDAFMEEAQRAA